MDLQPHFDQKSTILPTVSHAESALYQGAFSPRASGFTINGGAFTSNVTNNVYNPPSEEPSGRQKRRGGFRRMYTAKIVGNESRTMTVAVYQGNGAEEEWRQQVAKYESIRHPHIRKLYGLVRTNGLRAMVFLNELIPFHQFLNRFKYSRILTPYIYAHSLLPTVINPKNVADDGNARWQFGGDGWKGNATRSRFSCGIKRVAELGCSRH
ncbi:hypothetical protein DFH08DRAFT_809145 [Mycena albidolilacea]|uniref:Protein kinase domain-containing protein n=1 Tax=Mycena albidolilacea TaxID=1033008 RepID=A0AAD7A283_9AGAR|nr:hypothetical protein DFH08DRAFT_809145 [Mycena albidolilacea]